MSDLEFVGPRTLICAGRRYDCTIGSGGLKADKREGDGATPIGQFALRAVFYRPDRIAPPETQLPLHAILPDDLWCDDPGHPLYNQRTRQPFMPSAETLWRADHAYDLFVVIGHNDSPPLPGLGSAIFLHLKHEDDRPTAGCLALARQDLMELLPSLNPQSRLIIRQG
jgi:L,D-peptidoglycan transpeptidase YkuD (ErfK/YbiS/YcfS/YnhG family)